MLRMIPGIEDSVFLSPPPQPLNCWEAPQQHNWCLVTQLEQGSLAEGLYTEHFVQALPELPFSLLSALAVSARNG